MVASKDAAIEGEAVDSVLSSLGPRVERLAVAEKVGEPVPSVSCDGMLVNVGGDVPSSGRGEPGSLGIVVGTTSVCNEVGELVLFASVGAPVMLMGSTSVDAKEGLLVVMVWLLLAHKH